MEEFADRYGFRLVKLVDSRCTMKEFEFDQVLLMPTPKGYRALVEQADEEIDPKVKSHLLKIWSKGTLENLSYFVMAVAVYSRSVSDPPIDIDVGGVLLKTAAFCNLRCIYRKEAGGGCRIAMKESQHHLPKCIKIPKGIDIIWRRLKSYIATGNSISIEDALGTHNAMDVKIDLRADFAPATSC
jgi:hypothetical protein